MKLRRIKHVPFWGPPCTWRATKLDKRMYCEMSKRFINFYSCLYQFLNLNSSLNTSAIFQLLHFHQLVRHMHFLVVHFQRLRAET